MWEKKVVDDTVKN